MRPSMPVRISLATGLVAVAAYAASACHTITWWDGSSYPLAAVTLGIAPQPGSLLLTLLGWAFTRVPLVRPVAFQLNLLSALMGAVLAGLVARLAMRVTLPDHEPAGPREWFSGALAGLTLAFSLTPWSYAVQFTPYGLSACFTALILTAAWAWWDRPRSTVLLLLLFLLIGLDWSVHRTNLLLLPAALVWVALRRREAGLGLRLWLAPAAGLALGLAFHFLLIPIARRDPALNLGDPSTLRRFWSYVSMEEKGGGFLIQLYPRTASFLSVQLADYVDFLRRNLWPTAGGGLALLPASLVLVGMIRGAVASRRRTLGLLAFFACSSLGAVLYFNLPAHYFRSMDRHYLPSLVALAPFAGASSAALLQLASRARAGAARPLAVAIGALLALAPAGAWTANHRSCDLSRVRFTETLSRDVLEPLPERAILLTNGDNDSFPLWYLQRVEGVRQDVTVLNIPSTNTGWYVEQLRRREPDLADLLAGERPGVILRHSPPGDSSITVPVDPRAELDLPRGVARPDSVRIEVSSSDPDMGLIGQDRVIADLLRLNRWRRPVLLARTVARSNLPWLWPYVRFEGPGSRVMPTPDPGPPDPRSLRKLLIERTRYADLADSTIVMDDVSRAMASGALASLYQLAVAEAQQGDPVGCLETLDFLERHVPLWRSLTGVRAEMAPALRALRDNAVSAKGTGGAGPGGGEPRQFSPRR